MKFDTPLNRIQISPDRELFFDGVKVAYVLNDDALHEMIKAVSHPDLEELHNQIEHLKGRVLEEHEDASVYKLKFQRLSGVGT